MADDRRNRAASVVSTLATIAALAIIVDVWTGGAIRAAVRSWAASFGPPPPVGAAAPAAGEVAAVLHAAEAITREGR